MPYCATCGRDVCKPCSFKPANQNNACVVVASDDQLKRISHFQRLAMACQALGLSRRELPNWMADVIYGFRGKIVWPGGKPFDIEDEDIDGAFNDDGSFRWVSGFIAFSVKEPRQKPQGRMLRRLRLIDLAFRIAYPERAAMIAK